MKRYNINVVEHRIDKVENKAYNEMDLYNQCFEHAIQRTCDFSELMHTYNTLEEAEDEFSVLQPSTYVCGQKDGRTVSLEIKWYVLEEAEYEDDDEMQYAWEFIDCKFDSYPGPTCDEHEEE